MYNCKSLSLKSMHCTSLALLHPSRKTGQVTFYVRSTPEVILRIQRPAPGCFHVVDSIISNNLNFGVIITLTKIFLFSSCLNFFFSLKQSKSSIYYIINHIFHFSDCILSHFFLFFFFLFSVLPKTEMSPNIISLQNALVVILLKAVNPKPISGFVTKTIIIIIICIWNGKKHVSSKNVWEKYSVLLGVMFCVEINGPSLLSMVKRKNVHLYMSPRRCGTKFV